MKNGGRAIAVPVSYVKAAPGAEDVAHICDVGTLTDRSS